MPQGFPEAHILCEPHIIGKTGEGPFLTKRPAIDAHPQGKGPGKNNYGRNDHKGGNNERPVIGSKP
ncbi:hypothetical protein D3C80_1671370 [compost metagenome]